MVSQGEKVDQEGSQYIAREQRTVLERRTAVKKVENTSALTTIDSDHDTLLTKSFIVNSGTTNPKCRDWSVLYSLYKRNNSIHLGYKTAIRSKYQGTVIPLSENNISRIQLQEDMYAPIMCPNLFFITCMDQMDVQALIGNQSCTLIDKHSNDKMAYATLREMRCTQIKRELSPAVMNLLQKVTSKAEWFWQSMLRSIGKDNLRTVSGN